MLKDQQQLAAHVRALAKALNVDKVDPADISDEFQELLEEHGLKWAQHASPGLAGVMLLALRRSMNR